MYVSPPYTLIADSVKQILTVVKKTFLAFYYDDCMSMAAALAYYIIFALPSMLVIIIAILGLIVDPQVIQQQIISQVHDLIGPEAVAQVRAIIQQAGQRSYGGSVTGILGGIVLIVGATVAFGYLQSALNSIWKVKPNPGRSQVKRILIKRTFSFAMVGATAFLLLISVILSAVLATFGRVLLDMIPGLLTRPVALIMEALISFGVFSLLFALIFGVVPDAEISWKEASIGGIVTAFLFQVGKFLIGLYLGSSDIGTAYGAAGSLAIVLVWFYYSSIILFLGAEFTRIWAGRNERPVTPEKGAISTEKE